MNECLRLQSTNLELLAKILPKMDNFALQQIINKISVLKYRYLGSFPCDFVPALPNDTFAIINTEPSTMAGEHWIMIANFHNRLYVADSLIPKDTHS